MKKQYDLDFATYFVNFKGAVSAGLTNKTDAKTKKTNESTEAKGSTSSGLSKLSEISIWNKKLVITTGIYLFISVYVFVAVVFNR